MLIYYAEAIDARHPNRHTGDELINQLIKLDLTIYRPRTAWRTNRPNPNTAGLIETTNRDALSRASVMVADLTCGSPSLGVPAEIEYATRVLNLPTIVLRHDRPSVTLDANPLVVQPPPAWSIVQIAAHVAELAQLPRPAPRDQLLYTLADGTEPPTRAYDDDAGIDLITHGDHTVEPYKFIDIPTTVTGIQTPPDTWLMVTGRSSTFRKRGLHVPVSVIDPGWRGPLLVGAWNYTDNPIHLADGDRIGQIVAIHNRTAQLMLTRTTQLDPHQRGHNGFGSSG